MDNDKEGEEEEEDERLQAFFLGVAGEQPEEEAQPGLKDFFTEGTEKEEDEDSDVRMLSKWHEHML
eukprot:6652330-Alexandrium_andersonii.AAC.1